MQNFTLKYPVSVEGGQPVTALTFRRRKAKDLRRINEGQNDFDRGMIALSCASDQPMAVIEELDEDDLGTAMEALADFLSGTVATTAT